MATKDGVSESSDTVVFKFADNGLEIKNWSTYHFNQDFLKPTAEWSFNIDDADSNLIDTLVPGVGINLYINDLIQCSGIIERVSTIEDPNSGTMMQVQGRDIMAKVVEGIVNPKLQFPTNTTLETIVKSVLKPLGITKIENSDNLNLNALTGKIFPPDEDQGFTKKALKELKANYGEGAYQFIDKLLKHQGFMMWAKADGSGVIISKPNYDSKPLYNLFHYKGNNSSKNNIIYGNKVVDITNQPSLIYCKGQTNGIDADVISSDIIMINEFVGLDYNGNILPQVQEVLDQYKKIGVKILDLRDNLKQLRQSLYQKPIIVSPCFIKNDEATDSNQLQNFIKRTMSHFQVKMFNYHYRVLGHTQNKIPWAINTIVNVKDETLGIDGPLWILDRTFQKTYSEGTFTDLKLIPLNVLDISTTLKGKNTTTTINNQRK
jgi:prophage tail gpP-like protein